MTLGNAKARSAGAVACLLLLAVHALLALPCCLAELGPISGGPHASRTRLRHPRGIASSRDEPRLLSPGLVGEFDFSSSGEEGPPALRESNEGESTSEEHEAAEDSFTDSAVEAILTLSRLRATLEEAKEDIEHMMKDVHIHLEDINSTVAGAGGRASRTEALSGARLESLFARLSAQVDHYKLHLRGLDIKKTSPTRAELPASLAAYADDRSLAACAEHTSALDESVQEKDKLVARIKELEKNLAQTEVNATSALNESSQKHENDLARITELEKRLMDTEVNATSALNESLQEKETHLARIAELEMRLTDVNSASAQNESLQEKDKLLARNAELERRLTRTEGNATSAQNESLQEKETHLACIADDAELENLLTKINITSEQNDAIQLAGVDTEKITNASLVPSASSYFVTALASGFQEAGNKSREFNSEDLSILRVIASGMRAGEAGASLVELPEPLGVGFIEQVIDFSLMLKMPSFARAISRRALESSNATMLVNLLLVAEGSARRKREGFVVWEELSNKAVQRLACMIEEASKVEAFSKLPLELVQRVLVLVNDVPWPAWHQLDVETQGVGWIVSPPKKNGLYVNVTKHADRRVGVYLKVCDDHAALVDISGAACVGIDFDVQALNLNLRLVSRVVIGDSGLGWPALLPQRGGIFSKGDCYVFSYRARRSKLHMQCQVLLECIKAKIPPESNAEPLIVSAFELLRSQKGLEGLRKMLVEYMALAFAWDSSREVLGRLSLCDIEAIIAHPRLQTPADGEFFVLKAALDWARSSERLDIPVGAVVRVRNDSECEEWRRAECTVVEKIDSQREDSLASCLWKIVKTSFPSGETRCVEAKDLVCSGHIGLEQLLQHVRYPFIKLEQIKTLLSKEERALLRGSPAFSRALREAIEVQTGQRRAEELGERARQRDLSSDVIPALDSELMTQALMLSF